MKNQARPVYAKPVRIKEKRWNHQTVTINLSDQPHISTVQDDKVYQFGIDTSHA